MTGTGIVSRKDPNNCPVHKPSKIHIGRLDYMKCRPITTLCSSYAEHNSSCPIPYYGPFRRKLLIHCNAHPVFHISAGCLAQHSIEIMATVGGVMVLLSSPALAERKKLEADQNSEYITEK